MLDVHVLRSDSLLLFSLFRAVNAFRFRMAWTYRYLSQIKKKKKKTLEIPKGLSRQNM